ncbi:DNA alkylation repair protein [Nitrososphaera sp.]|uniref:DNA alkylation repair protein n=1 Tax=Nitrososphaera sp. TaxID=1971748 RepID=UPI00182251A7|nr:DNA alkylation repair protein [Nitrososphaera sp.]NWG37554.1 DNA alkylation repair protein [Nitrososphaera sp.]
MSRSVPHRDPELNAIKEDLRALADPRKARVLQRFFKTGPGEYGQGDLFIGVTVPKSRQVAKKHAGAGMDEVKELLYSKIHEERLVALLILVDRYRRDPEGVARFYLDNLGQVNNWDLVDLTAPKILGPFLEKRGRSLLYRLARSKVLWERRVAILTTYHYIHARDFADALKISEILLRDKHDLMHKAVGWMLREIGKRDIRAEEAFLQKHYKKMPRTMLRYAIEKFPERTRRAYLEGTA